MWSNGIIACPATGGKYAYWVKHYDEPSSVFGLYGGRISKCTIRKVGSTEDLFNFDRGEDVPCADAEVEAVLRILVEKYN